MNSLEVLINRYNATPPDHLFHQVMGHLFSHLNEAVNLNIYELSDLCFTSPSTMSRLVRHLGFKSFGSFQQSLSDALTQYYYHNRLLPWNEMSERDDAVPGLMDTVLAQMTAFQANYDSALYKKAADLLHSSKKVIIIMNGGTVLESVLQLDLIYSGIPCELVPEADMADMSERIDKDCCILFQYTNRINAQFTEQLFRRLSRLGTRMIVITNTTQLRIFEQVDCLFTFQGKMHLVDVFGFHLILSALIMHYRTAYIDRPHGQEQLPE